jgi:hypothetical protein
MPERVRAAIARLKTSPNAPWLLYVRDLDAWIERTKKYVSDRPNSAPLLEQTVGHIEDYQYQEDLNHTGDCPLSHIGDYPLNHMGGCHIRLRIDRRQSAPGSVKCQQQQNEGAEPLHRCGPGHHLKHIWHEDLKKDLQRLIR